jgi:tyrosine-specific transport protein
MARHPQLEAVSTLVGTVIGAGILGIPYAIAKAGLLNGIILILVLGAAVTILYLFYGEIVLRTRKLHQLSGYAGIYLGRWGKVIATVTQLISMYGALIAYLIGSGSALSAIFGGNAIFFTFGFLVVGSLLVHKGIIAVEKSESILMFIVIGTVLLISVLSLSSIKTENLTGMSLETFLVPYGLILFALMGTNAIPEMREELIGRARLLKRSIIIGMLIPILIYILFTIVVVGVVGIGGFIQVDEDGRIATIALIPYIGAHMAILGNLFAVFAMSTSFLSIGYSLKEMFMYDQGMDELRAFAYTFLPPLIPVLLRLTSFLSIVEMMGVLIGGITTFLIVLMFWRAKESGNRKPEYSLAAKPWLGMLLLLIVLIGTVYKLLS